MEKAWIRRPLTVTGIYVVAVLLLGALPVWLVLGTMFDVIRGKHRLPTVRLLGFALSWSWLESAGVTVAGVFWVTGRSRNLAAHYALQRWWASRMIVALRWTCGVKVEVRGVDTLGTAPLIALGRHASLADSLVSAWLWGTVASRQPRYVLKKELAMDPCLDIVGQRLPNYFVDRSAVNTQRELDGIRSMVSGLSSRDVAVIFPEGTRANPRKRAQLVEKITRRDAARGEKMSGLRHLLPPKPAGARALVEGAPGADIVMMSHVGFDGLDTFGGILDRLSHKSPSAVVVLERHSRERVPSGDAFNAWLDDQWVSMDNTVHVLLMNQETIQQKEKVAP